MMTSTPIFAQDIEGEVLIKADKMPYWAGCANNENIDNCTQLKIEQFVQNNIKYPQDALIQEIEGDVIIACVITKKGEVKGVKILKDIGGGCGDEASRLVSMMKNWMPAREDGEAVNVIHNIIINFTINQKNKETSLLMEPPKPYVPSGFSDSLPPKELEASSPSVFVETDKGKVYTHCDKMPYFDGCEGMINGTVEKRNCADKRLIQFLSENLQYPEAAKRDEIEGVVYISFIVNEMGDLEDIQLVRDIGGGCGEEALRVVKMMPRWEAGADRGKNVKVKMNLPVRFHFNSDLGNKFQIHWGKLKENKISLDQLNEIITDDVIVRNQLGDDVTKSFLRVEIQKKNKFKGEESSGELNFAMMRLLRKAKVGSIIHLTATVQERGNLIDVSRSFRVVKK